MIRKQTAGRSLPLPWRRLARCSCLRRRDLLSRGLLGAPFHQFAELKFELIHQNGGALGGISKPGVPEFGDL